MKALCTPTRRAVLTGIAAASVTATSAVAAAITDHADAELLRLGAEWRAAHGEYCRIDADYDARSKAAEAEYPDVPAALRVLLKDGRTTLMPCDRQTIEHMHALFGGMTGDVAEMRAFKAWHLGLLDEHLAACKAIEDRHGCRAAGFACDAAGDRVAEIEGQILDTPAHSPAGIAVKLSIISKMGQIMGDFEDGLQWVLNKVDKVAGEARRVGGKVIAS